VAEVPAPPTMKEVFAAYGRNHQEASAKLHKVDTTRCDALVPFIIGWASCHERNRLRQRLGFFGSTLFVIAGSSRRICVQWARPCRRFTGPSADGPM